MDMVLDILIQAGLALTGLLGVVVAMRPLLSTLRAIAAKTSTDLDDKIVAGTTKVVDKTAEIIKFILGVLPKRK